ncbi:O-antigen ligase family protein [Geomonas sp. RF6]|uniref:O-antigen ligase family protein n=1 Tax=Geomonas sp. RF6 TaxID=2897342 RepID=UPI001E38624D|nr:O-antigen ligase family protein [Geomonas sp. RF6]UFS69136.1 O-antigen ligase family protein [Geomonas sp. RF6]
MSISSILYLAFFLAGAVATMWYSPFYGILLYMMEYLVNPPQRWWYSELPHLRYSFLVMCLVVISYLGNMKKFTHNRVLSLPQVKWLAGLVVLVVISYLWAVDPEVHHKFATRYLKVLMFVILAYKVTDTPEKMEALLATYLVGTSYLALLIWQTGRTGGGRLEGIGCADGSDANGTAALLATAVPLFVFYLLFIKSRPLQFVCLVGLAFNLNALILLNSRGSFLAVTFTIAFFSWRVLREKGLIGQKAKIVVGVVGVAALFLYLADDVFWTRMSTLKEVQGASEKETHSRVDFWLMTPKMLGDHPLGGGARTYHTLSPYYLPKEWLTNGKRAVHSTWFEVLSDYGYQGLCCFIGYVASVFVLARKTRQRLSAAGATYHTFQATALESSWLSLLIALSFINGFYGELMYWLPFFIAAFANIHLSRPATVALAPQSSLG